MSEKNTRLYGYDLIGAPYIYHRFSSYLHETAHSNMRPEHSNVIKRKEFENELKTTLGPRKRSQNMSSRNSVGFLN